MDSREMIQLLTEIRDSQREHLAEYRRITQEQLELSRRAVQRQEQIGRLYQRVIAVGAMVLVALGIYLAWVAGVFR